MSPAATLWQYCSSEESWEFHLRFLCFSKLFQRWVTDKACLWLHVSFHKPSLYFCHQTSAKQELSWPKQKGGKAGEDHISTPHLHFLVCVSSFSWGRIGPFSQVHGPQATATSCSQGNSRVKEVKHFQWEQLNSATRCPKNTKWLQCDRHWKFFQTMLKARGHGLALLWAGGGSRSHLETLPRKKSVCKSRTHFSVIWHLKSSKIWTNYQRTKLWLTENHTHTYVEGQNFTLRNLLQCELPK